MSRRGQRGMSAGARVRGISIVCVYNDLAVRQDCLDRSISAYRGDVDVHYVPVDNRQNQFSSAGAALNHGAAMARHDVVVFVHQDVYLHSIDRIAAVAALLEEDKWGLLGASGVPRVGPFVGRMRDRVQVIGVNADSPREVDSVDEVLFMTRRQRVLTEPLSEDPDLSWHAYGVEYGLRVGALGLGVGAVNLAITHNSLTVNLDRLEAAHRRVAHLYPDRLPIRTTCGTIARQASTWRGLPFVREHGWRLGWLARSVSAYRARRFLDVPTVFSDIRVDVDLLDFSMDAPLNVVNFDRGGGFANYAGGRVRLMREGAPVVFWSASTIDEIIEGIGRLPTPQSVLIADLEVNDLPRLAGCLPAHHDWVLGLQEGATWLLGGPVLKALPREWSGPRVVPLLSQSLPTALR